MKRKSSARGKWEKAKDKIDLRVEKGNDGEVHVTWKRLGVGYAASIETQQAVTRVREEVAAAIEVSVSPSEGKEILGIAVGELLDDPKSKKMVIQPRVGIGPRWPEILLDPKKGTTVRFKDGDYVVVRKSRAIFTDNENAESLPRPVKSKDVRLGIRLFREITGLPKATCRLVIMFILAAYRPHGPYPILVIQGESGTAKSILTELIRMAIDPSQVPTIGCPASEKDLFDVTRKNHVLAFDNVSGLPGKTYDTLCRISSGGGIFLRKGSKLLGITEYAACRPIILNGIDNIGIRNDFLQRAIVISPPRIEDHKDEQLMRKRFKAALPKILGSLFQAVAHGYHTLKDVKLENKPRMAGFIKWSVAAGNSFGWTPEVILRDYTQNQKEAFQVLADSDSLMLVIQELVRREKEWTGTATQLLACIRRIADEAGIRELVVSKDIPRAANVLSERLNRSREKLMAYEVDYCPCPVRGARLICLRWLTSDNPKKED